MKNILGVKHYLQYKDVKDPDWHNRSCGITCVKMVLEFFNKGLTASVDDLIKEGLAIGGYMEGDNGGWYHSALTKILRNHGVHCYPEEFRTVHVALEKNKLTTSSFADRFVDDGLKKMVRSIDLKFPVIISVGPGFNGAKSNHLVVIVGYNLEQGQISGFFVLDPNEKEVLDGSKFVPISMVKKGWRKLAIFTYL